LEFDTSKEGNITLDELKVVLSRFDTTNEEIEKIFTGLDVDGTGKIGYTEFLAATLEAQGFAREDMLLEAFDRLDSDDSGYISEANLRDILGSAYKPEEVKQMIADADLKKV
jgi:calcium-dependent protein kinase